MTLQSSKRHLSLLASLASHLPAIDRRQKKETRADDKKINKKNGFKKESIGRGPIRSREGGLRKRAGQTKRWNSRYDRCCIFFQAKI
ncbi:hypothetical protein CEXT_377071 [Caerostris extrusa]|uniref:Uncharacterized protein n=1 Tax=Caerostris extrusa TaxID=172846 RepID=A0AAV4W0X9_CAEEX|nr:hypothetical protein CEXT_377071 [Caerostris extrusa]